MQTEIIKKAEDLKNTGKRIDIVKIANSLGIKVYSTSKLNVSSLIAFDRDINSYAIYVNSKENKERQRFSVAHEIAHFIQHKDKIKTFGVVGRQNDYSLSAKEEQEADHLAAQILMPPCCVKSFLEKINITQETKIDIKIIQKLAKEFEVNIVTAIMRLRELGYYVRYIEFR